MATRKRVESWVVTDDFWKRVEPLIPVRERPASQEYLRKPGAGRPPKPARQVFEAVVYVLRTGCQWKALPKERFGSASAVHKRFLEWEEAGVFEALLAGRTCRVRPDGRHCLAMAKHRRGHVQGAPGARGRGAQTDGSEKNREASDTCWGTGVAPRCRSS